MAPERKELEPRAMTPEPVHGRVTVVVDVANPGGEAGADEGPSC